MSGRDAGPSEWSSRALTRRLADYLVNAYTDGRGYDPTDLDDVEVTLRDGFDIVLGEMHEAQRDRSDGGGSEDSTTASECPATAEPPSAPVTASGGAEAEAARRHHHQEPGRRPVSDIRALSAAATPAPWELGDVWSWAGCGLVGNSPDVCVLCDHMGEPVWRGKADINGKWMHAHKHRNLDPYDSDHRITGGDGLVAGNYDYEEGGIIDPADAELIVALRNRADALADLADAVKAIPRHRKAQAAAYCWDCDRDWPCPTERAHRALDVLEATDG